MLRAFAFCVSTVLTVAAVAQAQEFDPAARAEAIAPFVDEQTFGVIRFDLARLNLREAVEQGLKKLPEVSPEAEQELSQEVARAAKWIEALRLSGGREIYVVASLKDAPARPPFVVVQLAEGADAEKLAKMIPRGPRGLEREDAATDSPFEHAVIRGRLCLGHANTLARLKEQEPHERADLVAAFKQAGDTSIQLIVLQSDDSRRVLRETLPSLPGELRKYSGHDLASIQYAAIGLELPPKLALRVGIQADDEAGAKRLAALVDDALTMGRDNNEVTSLLANYDELIKLLKPKQEGNRLSLELTDDKGGATMVVSLLTPAVQVARQAAQRQHSTNNLRQLALGMHIYHDAHKSFPPAATSKDGKQLLSWRVQLLPYLEQKALYDEFHHDEPWDSEHNKKLIEKMPSLFASPGVRLEPGYTVYLVPTGKGLIFNGDAKTDLSKITDGSSNTILIVEANADRAVPWTKPEDLEVDLDKPLAGLGEAREGGFPAAFADGSVHFISKQIDQKMLRLLLEMADGQPVQLP